MGRCRGYDFETRKPCLLPVCVPLPTTSLCFLLLGSACHLLPCIPKVTASSSSGTMNLVMLFYHSNSKGSKTHPHPAWCPEVKEKLGVCGAKTLRPTELSGQASFAGLDGRALPTGGPWGTQSCRPSAGGRKKGAFLFPRLGQWR